MARSRAGPRGAPGQGDQRNPHPRDSPEKGGMESTSDIITAAAPSSGEGLGHFVPRSEPPRAPKERKTKGRAPSEPGGVQKTFSRCPHNEQWPPTHPT